MIINYVHGHHVVISSSYTKETLRLKDWTFSPVFACLFVCAEIYNPGAKDVVDIPPPPMPMIAPPPIPPPSAPAIDELIQQSQWNLQQQEQHLHTLRQVKWKEAYPSLQEHLFPCTGCWWTFLFWSLSLLNVSVVQSWLENFFVRARQFLFCTYNFFTEE